MVSRHIWVPEGSLGKYLHRNSFRSHMSTGMLPGHSLALEGCPGTYGHCAQAPFRCPYVPGSHSGNNICLGTLPVPICARAPLRCPYVPGRLSGVLMCLGTLPVPICARAPFRFPYVLVHPSGAYIYPRTILVPICARAPFRCPYVPGHPSGEHVPLHPSCAHM